MLERLMLDLPHGLINKERRHNFYLTKKDYKFLIKVFKNIYTARNARNSFTVTNGRRDKVLIVVTLQKISPQRSQ
jgi:hypothetical protein